MDLAQAQLLVTESVERFRATVSQDDRDLIENTEIKDVVDAIILIEKRLRERRENRNLRKLHPFVQGIDRYSKVMDVLSNGLSPYLSWAWAPIRLMLQITSDYLQAFDKLLAAYEKIAATLPQVERLGSAFHASPALLGKLALYYADILEFHRRAYKFVRRKSWKFFFSTMWAGFDTRFDAILSSMAAHSDSIHSEAATIDIIESKQLRTLLSLEVDKKERDRINLQRSTIMSWLGLDRVSQDDECERLLRETYRDGSDWFSKTHQMEDWFKDDSKVPVLWLHGKPGAGKSVISASLVTSLQHSGMTTLSYFCKYHQQDNTSKILKTLLLQIVSSSEESAAVAYEDYVGKGKEPSMKVLRLMLAGSANTQGLLHAVSPCRIVIDGVDECGIEEQKHVVDDLLKLVSNNSTQYSCKLLVSSRETPEIARSIQKHSKMCSIVPLSTQQGFVGPTIEGFVHNRLKSIADERPSFQGAGEIIDDIIKMVIDKADGMFLWVKLVLESLDDADSMGELHDAIATMPTELSSLYRQVIQHMFKRKEPKATGRILRILAWLIFAKRPLNRHEILHGVGITPEYPTINPWTTLDDSIIDKCKPLVEELADGSIGLVHFTADEFLRNEYLAQYSYQLSPQEAITFACVSMVNDGLFLLEPSADSNDQLIQIVNGSYTLLPYALDFWLEHLLDSARETKVILGSPVGTALSALETCHCDIESQLGRDMAWKTTNLPKPVNDILSSLLGTPAYSLCASICAFRDECQPGSVSSGAELEKVAAESDPTLFSSLAARFSEAVQNILELTDLPNVPQEQLRRFQQQHSKSTYRCRFRSCKNKLLAFPSTHTRDSHERSHIKHVFCDKPMCPRGRVGFTGPKELADHNRTYHAEGSMLVPPRVRGIRNGHSSSRSPRNSDTGSERMQRRILRKNEKIYSLSQLKPEMLDIVIADMTYANKDGVDWNVVYDDHCDASLSINLRLSLPLVYGVVAWSLEGDLIAVVHLDVVDIFHAYTGEKRHTLQVADTISRVSFSPDSKTLAMVHETGTLRMWNYIDDKVIDAVGEHKHDKIFDLQYSSDGRTLASVGSNPGLIIWNTEDGHPRFVTGESNVLVYVAIDPGCRYVATSNDNDKIILWDMDTGLQVQTLEVNFIQEIAFSPSGQLLASCGDDIKTRTNKIWQLRPNPKPELENGPSSSVFYPDPTSILQIGSEGMLYPRFTPDCRWFIASSYRTPHITIWNTMTGWPQAVLGTGFESGLTIIAVSRSGGLFATAENRQVRIWTYN